MVRSTRFARLVTVGALVASTLAVVGIAPAQAGPAPTASVVGTQHGTATITYADTTKFEVYIVDGATSCEDTGTVPTIGILGTLGVISPAAASPLAIDTSTLVGPAPAHALGTGSFFFCLYDVTNSGATYTLLEPASTIAIFDQVTASMVDDGNGSLVVTYANLNSDFSQEIYVVLLSGVTTCPDAVNPYSDTGFGLQSSMDFPDSPMVIGVGTSAILLPLPVGSFEPVFAPVTAGEYLGCLYTTVDYDQVLFQSLPVSIFPPIPAPIPAPEPATPVFTG